MINRKIFFILILGLVFFYSYTNSQPKIRIILQQPPPNQMGVGDLWNLELTNITKENVKIYLKGTATEEKDGLIIEGTSKVFTVKPGTTNYKYSDFTNAEVKYNNGKYKEIILRTGNAPEGSYTICVTAFEETGDITGQENCIIQSVKQLGSISLISPEDGAEINPEQPIIFNWTPLPKGGPYTLRIVELKGSQSPDDAFRSNQPIFEKELRTTTYQGDPIHGIDVKLGMKYAWQVTSGDVKSENYVFVMFDIKTNNLTNDNGNGGCMLENPNFNLFETNSNHIPVNPSRGNLQGVKGWFSTQGTPDYFYGTFMNSNVFGDNAAVLVDNNEYAGIVSGYNDNNVYKTENIIGKLISSTVANNTYRLHAFFKIGNLYYSNYPNDNVYIEIVLSDQAYINQQIIGQYEITERGTGIDSWQQVEQIFVSNNTYNRLIIRGYDMHSANPDKIAYHSKYLFVDSVDICLIAPQQTSNDCVFSDNYDNSTNVNDPWNIVTSNSTLITSTNDINPCLGKTTSRGDNRISVSGGFCNFNNADEDGVDYRVWKNINTTLDNSWQADFEFSYNESGLGLDNRCGHPIFALTSGTDNPINTGSNKMCNFSNQDAIMVWMWQPTALYYNNRGETVPPAIQRVVGLTPWCKKGKDLDTYTPRDIFPILPNTFPTYYIRLERLNLTQGRLSVFSDAARTQRIMSSENKPYICFDIPSGLQNLNILQHSNAPHGSGRILTGKIDNTCIKDISDGIISDCGQHSPNCLGCQIITANISTFQDSLIQLRAYVGQNVGNLNPMFEDPQPDNFNNWPDQPIAPSISTLTNTRYVIKASGGLPDQWGRVYDAAYQLSGTWGNPTLPSCQGFAQFMLVNSNLFTLGKRPNYPNNLYNSAYHEYLYEFQTPSFPTGNITYSNINNVGGGSGNIQASYNFYMLCDTNNFKFVWKLIEGNHSDVTFSNENSSSPFFKATGQGQYTYELSIYCKSNNQLVDKDTSRIFVYPNTNAYLNNNQYVYPTPTTTCGCGCWNSISVGTSSGGPFNLIQHGGIVQVQQSTTDIYFKSSYSYVPTPSSLTNSLYCWVYKKNDINDVSWGTPIWEGYIINNPSTPNSLNLNSNITGNYYWVRINPQVPPSISPDYSCTERNFYLQIIP